MQIECKRVKLIACMGYRTLSLSYTSRSSGRMPPKNRIGWPMNRACQTRVLYGWNNLPLAQEGFGWF